MAILSNNLDGRYAIAKDNFFGKQKIFNQAGKE